MEGEGGGAGGKAMLVDAGEKRRSAELPRPVQGGRSQGWWVAPYLAERQVRRRVKAVEEEGGQDETDGGGASATRHAKNDADVFNQLHGRNTTGVRQEYNDSMKMVSALFGAGCGA